MVSPDPLVPFLRERAGELLRGVARYDSQEYRLTYRRQDIDPEVAHECLRTIYQNLQTARGDESPLDQHLGAKQANVQVRENGVVIALFESSSKGVLIALDPEASQELISFIQRCLQYSTVDTPKGPRRNFESRPPTVPDGTADRS
ncbi:MAG: hypothetical protein SVG88_13540 [Halobacteriales archaeon]|nr:hypothetical protein [Halobacteriales archaeon]